MRISKCTYNDLVKALELTNNKYRGNVEFRDFTPEQMSSTGKVWRIRLGVKDIREIGAALTIRYFGLGGTRRVRRSRSACWHVHGEFFDSLPKGTRIQTTQVTMMAGNDWQDYNVSGMVYPICASESCLCKGVISKDWAKSSYEKSKVG